MIFLFGFFLCNLHTQMCMCVCVAALDFAIKESNRSQQAMLVHLALIHEQFLTLAPKFCSTLVLEAPVCEVLSQLSCP